MLSLQRSHTYDTSNASMTLWNKNGCFLSLHLHMQGSALHKSGNKKPGLLKRFLHKLSGHHSNSQATTHPSRDSKSGLSQVLSTPPKGSASQPQRFSDKHPPSLYDSQPSGVSSMQGLDLEAAARRWVA